MGAFLGVAQGAATSPWLLEMRYNYKPDDTPIVLVGKGTVYTVEPPNKGHIGDEHLSIVQRLSLLHR